jgi:hypothetical protein
MKSDKPSQNGKERLRKAHKHKKLRNSKTPPESTPSNTLKASSPLKIDIIKFLLSTTLLAKSSTNSVLILFPFGNELIKHKLREERDAMQKTQN